MTYEDLYWAKKHYEEWGNFGPRGCSVGYNAICELIDLKHPNPRKETANQPTETL